MEIWSIDRFEGETAVCEDPEGVLHEIARGLFPQVAVEGDCFLWEGERPVLQPEATAQRRQRLLERTRALRQARRFDQ